MHVQPSAAARPNHSRSGPPNIILPLILPRKQPDLRLMNVLTSRAAAIQAGRRMRSASTPVGARPDRKNHPVPAKASVTAWLSSREEIQPQRQDSGHTTATVGGGKKNHPEQHTSEPETAIRTGSGRPQQHHLPLSPQLNSRTAGNALPRYCAPQKKRRLRLSSAFATIPLESCNKCCPVSRRSFLQAFFSVGRLLLARMPVSFRGQLFDLSAERFE